MLQILSNFREIKSNTSIMFVPNLKKSKYEITNFKIFISVQKRKIQRKLGNYDTRTCVLIFINLLN